MRIKRIEDGVVAVFDFANRSSSVFFDGVVALFDILVYLCICTQPALTLSLWSQGCARQIRTNCINIRKNSLIATAPSKKALRAAMRTRVKGRCQLKLTTLGAAKVCFLKENGIARVCEAHFCSCIWKPGPDFSRRQEKSGLRDCFFLRFSL